MKSDTQLIIYKIGDGWLAVEKPAGISIHNDPGKDVRSLLANLVAKDKVLSQKIDIDPDYGLHAVGRLDKGASGLMLMAWRRDVFAAIAAQYARHTTIKSYLVVLQGNIKNKLDGEDRLKWTWSLAEGAGGRRNPAGKKPRKPCKTDVQILKTARYFTLAGCRPQTGRKHQIRRHAALAGYPLAGDRRYGTAKAADRLIKLYGFDRIALHADSLTFKPPESNQQITISSAGMPQEFEALLQTNKASIHNVIPDSIDR